MTPVWTLDEAYRRIEALERALAAIRDHKAVTPRGGLMHADEAYAEVQRIARAALEGT